MYNEEHCRMAHERYSHFEDVALVSDEKNGGKSADEWRLRSVTLSGIS